MLSALVFQVGRGVGRGHGQEKRIGDESVEDIIQIEKKKTEKHGLGIAQGREELQGPSMGWMCGQRPNAALQSLHLFSAWRSNVWWRNTQAWNMLMDPNNRTRKNGDDIIEVASGTRQSPNGREQKTGWTRVKDVGTTKGQAGLGDFCLGERETFCHTQTQNWRMRRAKQRKKGAEEFGYTRQVVRIAHSKYNDDIDETSEVQAEKI